MRAVARMSFYAGTTMLKFITRFFRKRGNSDTPVRDNYVLPSDNPDQNPVIVMDEDGIDLTEVASLNSRLLAPVDSLGLSGMSVRTRALIEMKNGFTDLSTHIRSLGQRLHAQSLGQSRLIETLTKLPTMLREVIPNGEEQTKALAALKVALDEQACANQVVIESLKPLPAFVQAVCELPQAARQQVVALDELTRELERTNNEARTQSEQVKVMVESLVTNEKGKSEELKEAVSRMEQFQQAQLAGVQVQAKAAEATRRSQRRHHLEVARKQAEQLASLNREQGRYFARMEEHMHKSARRMMWVAGSAVGLAIISTLVAVLFATGMLDLGTDAARPALVAPAERTTGDAVVSR
ncbi:hypothetical protein EDM80_08495 [bacterium]|nr:MAG: hypothetical protein EDM80_08495 [bacterium]